MMSSDENNARIQSLGNEADLMGLELARLLARSTTIDHTYLRLFSVLFFLAGTMTLLFLGPLLLSVSVALQVASMLLAFGVSIYCLKLSMQHYRNQKRAKNELGRRLPGVESFLSDSVVIIDKIRGPEFEIELAKQKFARLGSVMRDCSDAVDRIPKRGDIARGRG